MTWVGSLVPARLPPLYNAFLFPLVVSLDYRYLCSRVCSSGIPSIRVARVRPRRCKPHPHPLGGCVGASTNVQPGGESTKVVPAASNLPIPLYVPRYAFLRAGRFCLPTRRGLFTFPGATVPCARRQACHWRPRPQLCECHARGDLLGGRPEHVMSSFFDRFARAPCSTGLARQMGLPISL